MPYRKHEPIPCIDRRPCRYRGKDGKCGILHVPYMKSGICPWCKVEDEEPEEKREMSPAEIVDKYLNLRPTRRQEPSCIFYQGADRRLCRATSNTSCKGCAFYSANKAARTEALAKLLLDSEEKQRRLEHKIVGLEWLLEQNEYFARIGRAIVKWRGQHGQNKNGA